MSRRRALLSTIRHEEELDGNRERRRLRTPCRSRAPARRTMHKGLKKGAIGYLSNVVIGVASTAPAYSLAPRRSASSSPIKGVGVHAPAVLSCHSYRCCSSRSAYKYLNRADPDAGTTFAWTTRAVGPAIGWMNGWAIFLADVIVMASLADIAADVHVQALRLHRTRRIESRDHHRGGPVDRADDVDLLPGDRAVGAHPAAACSAPRSRSWACSRSSRSSRSTAATRRRRDQAERGRWFNPFAMKFSDLVVGDAARGVHLLGLGFRRRGQRGVGGPDRGPRHARRWSRRSCSC